MGTPNFSTLADDICSRIIGPCEYFVFERTIWVNPTENDILQPNLPWNDAVLEAAGFVQVCGGDGGPGGGDPDQNLFETFRVSGQLDVVADNTTDILTLIAGTDIEILTDESTDSITFNATGAATDTNFANDNLIQDDNRLHQLGNFTQDWDDLGTFDLQINTRYVSVVGAAPNQSIIEQTTTAALIQYDITTGSNIVLVDNNGVNLNFEPNSDLKIDGDPGVLDYSIFSQGPDTPPIWAPSFIFRNIEVSGQDTVVADNRNDTLTLIAGTNISITTDEPTDSITINATGGGGGDQNLWESIAVSGQTTLVASETQDTLTLVAGTNITITTTPASDSVTINSTGGGGVITFSTALPSGGADGDTWFIEEESLYEGMVFQRQSSVWVYQGQWYVPRKTTSAATSSGGVITTQGDIDLIGAQLPAGKEYWWVAPTDVGAIEAADYQITEDGSGGGIQGKFPRGTSGGGAGAIQDLTWDNVNDWYDISDGGTTTFVDKVGWSLIDSIWVNGLDRKETRINQTLPALATAGDWNASLGFIGQWVGSVPAVLDNVTNLPLGEWMTIDFRKTALEAGITLNTSANFDAASITAAQFLTDSSIGHYEVTIRRTALGTGSNELELRVMNTGVRTGIGPALPAAANYDMWLLLLHPTLPDGLWLSNGTTWAAL